MLFLGPLIASVGSALTSAASVVSAGLTTLSTTAGGLVGTLASKATSLLGGLEKLAKGPLGKELGEIARELVVDVAKKGAEEFARDKGLISSDEKAEEVGYRFNEAALHGNETGWRNLEEFKSFKDLNDYLKLQIPDINVEKLNKNTDIGKFQLIGMQGIVKGIGESLEIDIPETFLEDYGKTRMNNKELLAVAETFKMLGYSSIKLHDFLTGKFSSEDTLKIQSALLKSYQKYLPTQNPIDILKRLEDMRQCVSNDQYLVDNKYKREVEDIGKNGLASQYLDRRKFS